MLWRFMAVACLARLAVVASSYPYELYGMIEQMTPAAGEWTVAGTRVCVDKETKRVERYGRLAVGALVEVEGREDMESGCLRAAFIKTRTTHHQEQLTFGNKIKFFGIVNHVPDTITGNWSISGQTVTVKPATEIGSGTVRNGSRVRVRGYMHQGRVIATEIGFH
jgi:hypothetical protein